MSRSCLPKKLSTYFKRVTGILPDSMNSLDSTRLVVLYFGIGGLAIIGEQDESRIDEIIEWIYCHQITLPRDTDPSPCGFRSSLYTGFKFSSDESKSIMSPYDCSHVTMVYTALCSLLILGDDLSRVDRHNVLSGVAALQCKDIPGLFKAGLICPERDMRFVFSAVASCYILDGLEYLDRAAIVSFIGDSLTYEGGFGNLPGLEAHAGATYCALASLSLLDQLHSFLPVGSKVRERLIRWLIGLQHKGFHGRPQKIDDTCYTFWVCASLKLLGMEHLVDQCALLHFVSECFDEFVGGIRKCDSAQVSADPLHSYLALSGLSCLKHDSLDPTSAPSDDGDSIVNDFRWLCSNRLQAVIPELNITEAAHSRLRKLHCSWRATTNE